MIDSDGPEALEADPERNRAERIEGIKRWVRHIVTTPPERWGPEQNAVVNAEVEAGRAADLDGEHLKRVERVARDVVDDK